MAKKEYGVDDWRKFREEILQLVILYKQIKEYTDFDESKIVYIKSFFHLSRNNAISAFFIKVGFLIKNGSPTLHDFLSEEDFLELFKIYTPKVQKIRDKVYAHNNKAVLPPDFRITNEDVEEVYSKIISLAEKMDSSYGESFLYDFVTGADGIKSIESLIDDSNKWHELINKLLENDFNVNIEMDIRTGELKISKNELS